MNGLNFAWKQAFSPLIGTRPKVLILGSLPGDASLAAGQYYAHPRNQFWRLLGDISGQAWQHLAYEDKLRLLQQLPVIVWDVVERAQRQGSLDTAIRAAQIRDLNGLLAAYPSVVQIWFNGQQAAKLARQSVQDAWPPHIILPSSSPAYTLAYEHKLAAWQSAWQAMLAME